MMLTEYWIFMLVWCFTLGKLEECTSCNVRKNIFLKHTHETLKTFTTIINLISLQMHFFSKWGSLTHLCKGREPLADNTKVWLTNRKYVWQSSTKMLFQKLPITALFSERFIKILWQWCSSGNLLKRIKWRCY